MSAVDFDEVRKDVKPVFDGMEADIVRETEHGRTHGEN